MKNPRIDIILLIGGIIWLCFAVANISLILLNPRKKSLHTCNSNLTKNIRNIIQNDESIRKLSGTTVCRTFIIEEDLEEEPVKKPFVRNIFADATGMKLLLEPETHSSENTMSNCLTSSSDINISNNSKSDPSKSSITSNNPVSSNDEELISTYERNLSEANTTISKSSSDINISNNSKSNPSKSSITGTNPISSNDEELISTYYEPNLSEANTTISKSYNHLIADNSSKSSIKNDNSESIDQVASIHENKAGLTSIHSNSKKSSNTKTTNYQITVGEDNTANNSLLNQAFIEDPTAAKEHVFGRKENFIFSENGTIIGTIESDSGFESNDSTIKFEERHGTHSKKVSYRIFPNEGKENTIFDEGYYRTRVRFSFKKALL